MFKANTAFISRISSASLTALMAVTVCLSLCTAASAQVPDVQIKDRGDLTGDEVATMLGVHIWKFDVVLPTNATGVTVSLQQRDKNGGSQGLTSMTGPIDRGTPTTLLVGVIPIGGDLTDAQKVRVVLIGFGINSSQTVDNPLNDMAISHPSSPVRYPDGGFALVGGFQNGQVASPISTEADSVIALQIIPTVPQ
ncbi:MAG: hypothetical protein ABSH22_10225 [Tepidisphaeraceae bacterium]|jgi:hypothetical protein